MPDAVAERLDRVLVGLADERTPARTDQPADPPVTDLAARRRRRRGVQLLVAAAAVIVAGDGVNQMTGTSSDEDSGGERRQRGQGETPGRPNSGVGEEPWAANEDAGTGRALVQPTTVSDGYTRCP